MDKEKTIAAIAVSLVVVVLLIGGLAVVFILGLSPAAMFRTTSSSSGGSMTVMAVTAVPSSPMPTIELSEVEVTRVEVTRVVVTAAPSPTPAVCTPLPQDMTFSVIPTSDTAVVLELTGLQPGESLHFIFSWEGETGSSEIQLYDLPPVGDDGRYIETIDLQQAEAGTYTWQIKVIHARGVACTEITLPEGETAVHPPELLTPPQVNCPDPQIDDMVGTLIENDRNTIYTNPVLGIELTWPDKLCVHEPDYLFDHYGFTLSDPESWEGALLSVDWLYQAAPDQLETHVQESIDSFPELEVNREAITINELNGVMLWPLPGTEATTQIYLAANNRLYRLIFWSAPPDEQDQVLLNGLHFIEPTRSLDSLNLPQES